MSAVPLDSVVEPVIGWRGWFLRVNAVRAGARARREGPRRLAVARSHDGAVRRRARASQPGPLVRMRAVRVEAGDGAPLPPVAVPGDRDRVDVGSDRRAPARVARRARLPRAAPAGLRYVPAGANRPADRDPRRRGNDRRGRGLAGVRVRLVRRPRPIRPEPDVVGTRGRQGAPVPVCGRSDADQPDRSDGPSAAEAPPMDEPRPRRDDDDALRAARYRATPAVTAADPDVRTPRPGRDIPQLMPVDVSSKDRPSEPSSTGIDEAAGCSSVSASIASSWSSVCSGS